eukprot:COSAG02_NODE_2851_length_7896_cov_28.878928_2_plen_209_part_00
MSLEPEQRPEISVALQPMVTGNSSWLVSVVDPAASSAERLLRRLLVTAAVPNPNVARTYEAALVRPIMFCTMFTGRSTDHQCPVAGTRSLQFSAKEKKMRILYTNPYRDVRTFLLRTDRPDLLNFEVRVAVAAHAWALAHNVTNLSLLAFGNEAGWATLVGRVVRHPALCLRTMMLLVCRRISWRYRLEKDDTCIYGSRCSLRGLSSR